MKKAIYEIQFLSWDKCPTFIFQIQMSYCCKTKDIFNIRQHQETIISYQHKLGSRCFGLEIFMRKYTFRWEKINLQDNNMAKRNG